jgi:hypothetical protein
MHVALPPPHRVKKNAFYQNKIRIKGFYGLRSCFDLSMKNLDSVVTIGNLNKVQNINLVLSISD